ncbi:FkbM family methyltransferase [Skermanella mucosa]|uniref:FkbM family methyltransferase n=1 Tax=Skermanella mucosa TaxID=1789672 RepID=UPI00192C3352|nr:FkbM family methyltransferase [Skermanella mucosa]UEM19404.1 FkbM family methyltransferase [Skermanella mucosa]
MPHSSGIDSGNNQAGISHDPPFGTYAPSRLQRAVIGLTRTQPETWLGKRIAFAARRLVLAGLKSPLDVDVFGRNFRIHPEDNVCEKRVLFTPQFFDPVERQVLAAKLHDGFTFVDLGANVGVYSLFVAGLAGKNARVLAVEPQPEIYRRLAFNVAANDLGTIRTLQCAVADRTGNLDLFIDRGNRGQSSIAMKTGERVSVPCRTLDGLLAEAGFDRVDALKIDIEGAEDTVLVPFFASAPERRWPALILLETSSDRWKTDCVKLCIDHGYRISHTTRLNVILQRTPDKASAAA